MVRKLFTLLLTIYVLAAGPACANDYISLDTSPWTKACTQDRSRSLCITFSSATSGGEIAVAGILFERESDKKRVLRAFVPLGYQLVHGSRLIVDKNAPTSEPFANCLSNGCFSDYVINNDVLKKLRSGKAFVVQVINSDGTPITLPVKLDGFDRAYGGPPSAWASIPEADRRILDGVFGIKPGSEQVKTSERTKDALPLNDPKKASPDATAAVATSNPAAIQGIAETTSLPVRRVALVLGNSAYQNVPRLPNPTRDAASVASALQKLGFQNVTLLTDLNRDQLVKAFRDFAKQAENADWAVVYYAGHGIEAAGVNYLIPVDATITTDRDISLEAVSIDQVLNSAERARALRLVLMDACRDNPFANQMKRTMTVASRSVSRGLAQMEPDPGTLVIFAAKHGETALDGDFGNSPFATAFIKNIQVPGIEVRRLFDNVRDDVMESTGRRQQPYSYGSVPGRQDFYFVAR